MSLSTAAEKIISDNPNISRRDLAELLDTTEWQARRVKEKILSRPPPGLSIAYFDLETTDLVGDFGQLLCGSIWSYPSGEMITYRIDEIEDKEDFSDDRVLAIKIRDKLEEHDFLVGYFSKGFDIPFLQARLADHGERLLSSPFHFDCIWHFKGWRGLKLRSSSMKVVAQFLDLERKQDVDVEVWKKCLTRAAGGNFSNMDIIVDRCESDVRITADIARWCWDHGHPKTFQRYP